MSDSLNNNNVLSNDKEIAPNQVTSDIQKHQDNCCGTSVGNDIPNDVESSPEGKEERQQKGVKRFLGIILTVAAAFQISFSALIVKILKYHPLNLGVWRFAVMSSISAAFLVHAVVWKNKNICKGLWPLNNTSKCLILQAVVGANCILLILLGLKYLDLADATVISTSAPIFVTLVAFRFLGEKCGVVPILTAVLALVGVGIISKPPLLTGAEQLNKDTLIGVTSSFSSMLLLTIQYVAMRYIRTVHHALVNLCFALWGFLESLVLAYALGVLEVPANFQEAGLIIATAVLVYSSLTCITLALKYEQAGTVALVRTVEVVFAFLWQAFFLGVQPDVFSVIGAIIVLSGVLITSLRKLVISLPNDHNYKKRFAFLML